MPIEILIRGEKRTIAFAACRTGDLWAKRFFEDELPDAHQLRVRALCGVMADYGYLHDKRKFRLESGEIWAFKLELSNRPIRFPCFRIRECWFLTHGFFKQGQRWRREQIKRAERIRSEHLEIYGESTP